MRAMVWELRRPECGNVTTAGAVNWAVINGGGTIPPLPERSRAMDLRNCGHRALHALGSAEGSSLITAETAIAGAPV